MDILKITIAGNGGCLNNGLPHNAFLMNDHFLIEAPPDIMFSLRTLSIDVKNIDTIFISHLHGDHTFGLPFIIINKWIKSLNDSPQPFLKIIGPQGVDEHVKKITNLAFTKSHPCYEWLEQQVRFNIIHQDNQLEWNSLTLSCFELDHLIETYGFFLARGNNTFFAYIADTKWCKQVESILEAKPNIVFIDMNGGVGNIHISLDEVREKGVLLTGDSTVYYGMHLSEEFEPIDDIIKCAKQGEEILIQF